jgi:thiol-disulfide isomerase/thioredoxin
VPARTRLIKQALIIFAIIFLGFIVARTIINTDTPSYELSNSVDLSKDGIATNNRLTGLQLPNIELANVAGEKIYTQSLLGAPIILNIWYSTCEPCRRELPVLASAAMRYRDQVRFIGVNIKDSASVAEEFAAQYGVKFELLFDTNGQFISQLGIATAPVTLAVDAQGKIIEQIAGEISAGKLNELVSELLK